MLKHGHSSEELGVLLLALAHLIFKIEFFLLQLGLDLLDFFFELKIFGLELFEQVLAV